MSDRCEIRSQDSVDIKKNVYGRNGRKNMWKMSSGPAVKNEKE